jgi:hypothetical protein
MRPYITGSGKPKEERQHSFCVGAKRCSGKAKTDEEAAQLCATTLPKWARQALPKEDDNLSCESRMVRTNETVDKIILGLKTGDIAEMVPTYAQLVNDVSKCRPPEVIELAGIIVDDLKKMSKRAYLKGEARDAENQLQALRELLS